MNKEIFNLQKQYLQAALHYASIIETCDTKLAVGNHAAYYKTVREEAISNYADAMADIINNSIDIAVEFNNKPMSFDQRVANGVEILLAKYPDSFIEELNKPNP